MLRAVLDLTKRYDYAYVISYEEPVYVYPGDLSDVTGQRHITRYSAKTVFIPRGGNLQLPVPAAGMIDQQEMYSLLQQLVESWNDSGQGGAHFQVEEDGATFHIAPTEVRDKNGNWQFVGSIMSDLISLPIESRNKYQMFDAICGALSASAGVKVYSELDGGLIIGARATATYALGATNESAGSVLTRAFRMLGQTSRTWYLVYDPTMHAYYMNIDEVVSPAQLPSRPPPPPARVPTVPVPSNGCSGPSCAVAPPS